MRKGWMCAQEHGRIGRGWTLGGSQQTTCNEECIDCVDRFADSALFYKIDLDIRLSPERLAADDWNTQANTSSVAWILVLTSALMLNHFCIEFERWLLIYRILMRDADKNVWWPVQAISRWLLLPDCLTDGQQSVSNDCMSSLENERHPAHPADYADGVSILSILQYSCTCRRSQRSRAMARSSVLTGLLLALVISLVLGIIFC